MHHVGFNSTLHAHSGDRLGSSEASRKSAVIAAACSLATTTNTRSLLSYCSSTPRFLFDQSYLSRHSSSSSTSSSSSSSSSSSTEAYFPCILSSGRTMALRIRPQDVSQSHHNEDTKEKSTKRGLLSKSMAELIAEADALQQRRFDEAMRPTSTTTSASNNLSPEGGNLSDKRKKVPAIAPSSMSLWVEKYTPKSFSQVRQ